MKNNFTREKILNTAMRLFNLRGYHAIGLNQIISESNVPKGSLYHYFPGGKEQLALEVIEISTVVIEKEIQHFFDITTTPVEGILKNIDFISDTFESLNIEENREFDNVPFGLLAMESAFENENIRKACAETFYRWESVYSKKLLEQGYSVQNAADISNQLVILIEGAVMLALAKKSREPFIAIKKVISELLLK